jgi:radical SAM protein with 4Fe4S-binding SPASM domain
MELTLRCNLRCRHCYNFDRELPAHPTRDRESELGSEEILRLISEVRERGCLYLAFTGGEATLQPDLEIFAEKARSLGMFVRLKSNGTLLTQERLDRLQRTGVNGVDVSLYGAVATTHDTFVRSLGAFDKTWKHAIIARDAGMEVAISFVLTSSNWHEAEDMFAMAQRAGIPANVDTQILARYDGSRSSCDEALTIDQLQALYQGPLRDHVHHRNDGTSVQCSCARSVCGIAANGDVYPCIGAPLVAGNVRTQTFAEIWEQAPLFRWIRGLSLDDFTACRACEFRTSCRRSSGAMFTNTGSYTGPAEFGGDWVCGEAELLHHLGLEEPSA